MGIALFIRMEKTKNIFWLLSVFVLTLCSCSNDNDDSVKLLKKVVETQEGGTSETTLFTYNGTEIVRIDGAQKRTDFTYTDGLITKIVTLNKTNQLLETTEYSYLEGKLVEVRSLENYRIKYIHISDNTVSYQKYSIGSGNQEVKEFHGILYFENDNLIKEERVLDNTAVGVTSNYSISFDYDAKENPLFGITGYKKLLDQNQAISSNNSLIVTEMMSVTKNDQTTSSATFYKCIFKYDAQGYPTEQIAENANSGTLKSEYFY